MLSSFCAPDCKKPTNWFWRIRGGRKPEVGRAGRQEKLGKLHFRKKFLMKFNQIIMEKRRRNPRRRLYRFMKSCCLSKFQSPQHYHRHTKQENPEQDLENTMEEEEESNILCLPHDLLMECLARLPRSSIQSSMLVSLGFYNALKSPSYYELRRSTGKLESLLFVFGGAGTGLSSAVYCKSNGGWKAGLLFSGDSIRGNEWVLDYHSADNSLLYAQPAIVKQQIFILAAVPCPASGNEVYTIVYDAWTKSLIRRAPMLCPRKKFACCVIANRIFVAGGALRNDSNREALVDAEQYIPELDEWKPIANMPRKRYGCLGAAVNGIFYVIGGLKFGHMNGLCVQPYAYVGSMDSFDPKTNTWLKTKALPMGGCVIACTVIGSCIYMLSSHAVELSFWKYATDNDTWTRIKPPPIPSPLRMDSLLKFSCVSIGALVYIIQVGGTIDDLLRRSGRSTRGLKEGLVLIFDTKLQEWQRGPDLPYIKNGAACAVVEC
ncbi:hypothetical protein SUGI_0750710 [Cryptomeria japonica]|uniref:F-box/kelch-repeat protein At5g26960 n=1 Tax=Cryptomeria japonica TaxID=3369 RepID=UPI0024148F6C|nr:F-box/kelch-repeat protein At5g26960 [Cryptomeria japonica]GLJ37050.1 hypothetical protein SUGI_0750710 [Cryptomeria japonica]